MAQYETDFQIHSQILQPSNWAFLVFAIPHRAAGARTYDNFCLGRTSHPVLTQLSYIFPQVNKRYRLYRLVCFASWFLLE